MIPFSPPWERVVWPEANAGEWDNGGARLTCPVDLARRSFRNFPSPVLALGVAFGQAGLACPWLSFPRKWESSFFPGFLLAQE